jgi:kynureninase
MRLPGKPRVLTTDAEFDSIDFILRVYRDKGRIDLRLCPSIHSASSLRSLVLSTVAFRTGRIFPPVKETIERARASKRSFCSMSITTPGAAARPRRARCRFRCRRLVQVPARRAGRLLALCASRHHGLRTLDTGWFAKEDVFAYERPEPPRFAAGGDAWLESTPPVLAPFQALAGLESRSRLAWSASANTAWPKNGFLKRLLRSTATAMITALSSRCGTQKRTRSRRSSRRTESRPIARGEYLRICPDTSTAGGAPDRRAHIAELIKGEPA